MARINIVLLFFFILSCKSQDKKKIISYNQKIILSNKLSDKSEDLFPPDLVELCSVFEAINKQNQSVYDPTSSNTFIRIDIDPSMEQKIELKSSTANLIQNLFKIKTMERINERVKETFAEKKIGGLFSQNSSNDKESLLYNFLSENKDAYIISYSNSNNQSIVIINSKNYFNYSIIDSVRDKIVAALSENPRREIIILYNPYIRNSGTTNTNTNIIHTEHKIMSSTSSMPVSVAKTIIKTKTIETTIESQMTANSLEEYFRKLGDPNIPYKRKAGIKSGILSYFISASVPVIKMNNGQETNDGTKIGTYVESVRMLNKQVTINNRVINNGKISKIYITEQ